TEHWEEVFQSRMPIPPLERALQRWLPARRWFGAKTKTIKYVKVQELVPVPLPSSSSSFSSSSSNRETTVDLNEKNAALSRDAAAKSAATAYLAFLHVEFIHTDPELYVVPLACAFGDEAAVISQTSAPQVIARVALGNSGQVGVLYEAIASKPFCNALLKLIAAGGSLDGKRGRLEASRTPELSRIFAESETMPEPVMGRAEQSNSSVIYGDKLMLKFFRRMELGPNPDLEISRFLTAKQFTHTPLLAGSLEYRVGKTDVSTVAMLSAYVPGARDAWEYTLDSLGKFYERTQTLPPEKRLPQVPTANVVQLASSEIPTDPIGILDTYAESARLLGQRTAEMHLALAAESDEPAFAGEPFTPHSQRGLFQAIRNLTRQNFQLLQRQMTKLPADVQPVAQQVLSLEPEIIKRLRGIYERHIESDRIRHHGDFHLGQVLYTGKDFLIIDFEGEPAIALSERRLKRSPLRDVAGMIRSFQYAVASALQKQVERGTIVNGQHVPATLWSQYWARWVSAIYFRAYRQTAGQARFMPQTDADLQVMMDAFLLRKAIYELGYELNNRPEWVGIPLQGIIELIENAKG
ncbi:MAG TPA: putative maltokinase, partial [Desulfuromonadaceae bacterium]|nr:putative maltokinase [Desulfuromonadaceae bacterium]